MNLACICLFLSTVFISASLGGEINNLHPLEIRIKKTLPMVSEEGGNSRKNHPSLYSFPVLYRSDALNFKNRKHIQKHAYCDIRDIIKFFIPYQHSKPNLKKLSKDYIAGNLYLEWSYGKLLFQQYCNAADGLNTLALTNLKKNKTYYKQQNFDEANNLIDIYTDSKYQIVYWQKEGKWFIETDSAPIVFKNRFLALFYIKMMGGDPFNLEPYSFAHPAYRQFIDNQEEATRLPSKIGVFTSIFNTLLILGSNFLPAIQYKSSSPHPTAAAQGKGSKGLTSQSIAYAENYYPSFSGLEYLTATTMSAFFFKSGDYDRILSIKSTLALSAFYFLFSPLKVQAQFIDPNKIKIFSVGMPEDCQKLIITLELPENLNNWGASFGKELSLLTACGSIYSSYCKKQTPTTIASNLVHQTYFLTINENNYNDVFFVGNAFSKTVKELFDMAGGKYCHPIIGGHPKARGHAARNREEL